MGNGVSTEARARMLNMKLAELKVVIKNAKWMNWRRSINSNEPYSERDLALARQMVASLKAYTPEYHRKNGAVDNVSGRIAGENTSEVPEEIDAAPVSKTTLNSDWDKVVYLDEEGAPPMGPTKTIYRDATGEFGFDLMASDPEDGIKVYSVRDGSPAHLAGVQAASVIMELNGIVTYGMTYVKIHEMLSNAAEVINVRFSIEDEERKLPQNDLENLAALKLQAYFKELIQRKRERESSVTTNSPRRPSAKGSEQNELELDSPTAKHQNKHPSMRTYRDPLFDRSPLKGKSRGKGTASKRTGSSASVKSRSPVSKKSNRQSKMPAVPVKDEVSHIAHSKDDAHTKDDAHSAAVEFDLETSLINIFSENGAAWEAKAKELKARHVSFAKDDSNIQDRSERDTTPPREKNSKDPDVTHSLATKKQPGSRVEVFCGDVKEGGLAMKISGSKVHTKLMGTYVELDQQYCRAPVYCKFDKEGNPVSYFYHRDKSWKISRAIGKLQCAISTSSPATRPDKAKSIWYEARGPKGKAMQGHPGIVCEAVRTDDESSAKVNFRQVNAQRQLYL